MFDNTNEYTLDTGAWVVECPLGKWIDDCSNCSSWGCCTLATSCYPVKREEQEDLVKPVQDEKA